MAGHRPRRTLGHTPLTPAQLEDAAKITPADLEHARASWHRDAPANMRQLLDARAATPPRKRKPGTADSGT